MYSFLFWEDQKYLEKLALLKPQPHVYVQFYKLIFFPPNLSFTFWACIVSLFSSSNMLTDIYHQ